MLHYVHACTVQLPIKKNIDWNIITTIMMIKLKGGESQATLSRKGKGGRVGWRCSHRQALPCHKAIVSLPKRCLVVVVGSGEPALLATGQPSLHLPIAGKQSQAQLKY